ncbi:Ku protein [Umezawaea sp. Da 62-37]|uniref:non-homologous end joining protein Ku n=1 Tax=Umezawaea sp. Da 62-37 TaxID=3075927 RepID=UPI0028F71027|nr:Ku protein [Umezawaea sp. Da 62-37]WNV86777.1 Ku protein [Umezawaea sp. Da 62-37]
MRALWRGAISFGLVSIPVRVFGATEEHGFRFHQVHRADGGQVRHRRVCSVCEEEVPAEAMAKGYRLDDGRVVVVEPEDFEGLPSSSDHVIDVVEFVSAEQIDPIFLHRSYFLRPDEVAVPSYALLREALERSWRMAVVKITLRRRETLAVVRPRGDLLVLHTLLWPDEVRDPGFELPEVTVGARETRMALALVDSMTARFDHAAFTDDYRDALEAVIRAKSSGAVIPAARVAEQTGAVDLVVALQRSLERVREGRTPPAR